jgi:hypothetical protein
MAHVESARTPPLAVSRDRQRATRAADHGFRVREFGVRADVKPGQVTRVRIVPTSGHEDRGDELVVVD